MRSLKKRSLLGVNEHFEGEHNDKIHFLFSLFLDMLRYAVPTAWYNVVLVVTKPLRSCLNFISRLFES